MDKVFRWSMSGDVPEILEIKRKSRENSFPANPSMLSLIEKNPLALEEKNVIRKK